MTTATFRNWFQPIDGAEPGADESHLLVCFPYSGLGTALFAPWRKLLGPSPKGLAVKLPGREAKLSEPPRTELVPLAEELAATLAESAPGASVSLAGFSLGGLLAFETARALHRLAVPIKLLAVGATRAPQTKPPRKKLHQLDDDRFLKELDRVYGGVNWQVLANEEVRRMMVPTLRADLQMYETYEYAPEPELPCELLTLVGTDDRAVSRQHVAPWRELAASYRHRSFPGDHFFAKSHPKAVLDAIQSRLRRLGD